jgi:hypothetical protein
MGATIWEVVLFVSKDILSLVTVSVLLAWVAAYFFMQNWLKDFPYNIGFKPWIYAIAALAAMVISLSPYRSWLTGRQFNPPMCAMSNRFSTFKVAHVSTPTVG